jgi:hypothetical protein
MKKFVSWILGPLLLGGALGALMGARQVQACSCIDGEFWVLERARPEPGEAGTDAALWPESGHLYGEQLTLWGPERNLRLEYTP